MNAQRLIVASVVAAAAVSAVAVAASLAPAPDAARDFAVLDFDYSMNSRLSGALVADGVLMSPPVKASKAFAVQKYCTFFADPQKQSQIQYCTSTELLDADGRFLGNIHMAGTPENPRLVITMLEAGPDDTGMVSAVFDTVIDNTVCECWEDASPGGFSTVSEWVAAMADFHRQASEQVTAKSDILTIHGVRVQSELTPIEGAHVWKLFVAG